MSKTTDFDPNAKVIATAIQKTSEGMIDLDRSLTNGINKLESTTDKLSEGMSKVKEGMSAIDASYKTYKELFTKRFEDVEGAHKTSVSYSNKRIDKIQDRSIKLFILAFVLIFVAMVIGVTAYTVAKTALNNTSAQIEEMSLLMDRMYKDVNRLEDYTTKQEGIIDQQNERIDGLTTELEDNTEKLQTFEDREELYDKYENAIMDQYGNRTDLTYAQLEFADSKMKEEGFEDASLLLALVMVESRGREDAQNQTSSARGYGQIIASTAKSIYENKLSRGAYRHEMAYNGQLNLEMCAELLSSNMAKYGNVTTVIDRYRGLHSDSYIALVEKQLKRGGTSLAEVQNGYRKPV
jgi:predicted nuclease with TOPRIM domain